MNEPINSGFASICGNDRPRVVYRDIDSSGVMNTVVNIVAISNADTWLYPKGIKVSDEEFAAIRISRDEFHGEWNYSITPSNKKMIM